MASFTKKAIRDSFVKLLNEKSLSQITIRDIVDDCGREPQYLLLLLPGPAAIGGKHCR